MTESTPPELDPREELALLAASTRALLEQYEASGADLLPSGAPLPRVAAPARGAPVHPEPPTRTDAPARHEPPARPPPREPAPAPQQAATPTPATSPPAAPPVAAPAREPIAPPPAAPPREPIAAPAREPAAAPAREPVAPPAQPPHSQPARVPPTPTPAEQRPRTPPEAARATQPGAEMDDRRMRLALLAEEVRACTKCVLCETRTQTVFARGNPFAELCFVGEGPGADEDAQGEPFVGAAGQLLDRMVAAMGYRRDDVYICNIVKCRPPKNRKPEPSEMDACMPYLREQLALVKPKVIVALGATAVSGLLGTGEGIMRLRGKWKLLKGTIPVMPTFHPAYLLRTPAAKREVWSDLQEVMKHLGKPLPRSGGDPRGRGEA